MKKTFKLFLFILAGMMAFNASANSSRDNLTTKHRPIIEEYTGTWCGWCPRGFTGMELLREHFGEDFIGVAIHNDDPMAVLTTSQYPSPITGFPSAFVERSKEVDPYYGNTEDTPAGIITYMDRVASRDAVAAIGVAAEWTSQDQTDIDVHVSTFLTSSSTNGKYAIEVMLIADDLYGTSSDWSQSNYFRQYASYFSDDPYLAQWTTKPGAVKGLHYNDVLVGTSGVVSGSLPTSIVAREIYDFDYTFTLSSLPVPSLIQNKDNLHVIAIIVEKSTEKVINANRCYIEIAPMPVVPGDVNGDGNVGIADVTDLIDYILGNELDSFNEANADIDSDGNITIADVTGIIDAMLGLD